MRKRRPKLRDEVVTLAHGAGGKASRALVEGLFLQELGNPLLDALGDAAVLELGGARLAFTTDSYVVKPLVFPGGDIGELAVNGTVNDLAGLGRPPRFLSAGFVIEEGFPIADLRRIAASMARAAEAASVSIAAGDTKVVERGNADGLYVNTAGIGVVPDGVELGPGPRPARRPGARLRHARRPRDGGADRPRRPRRWRSTWRATRLRARARRRAARARRRVRWMRDPTRGGLATALNELAGQAGVAVALDEASLPLRAGGRRRLRDPRDRSALRRQRGEARGRRRARARGRGARRAAPPPAGAEAAIVGEVRAEPAGMVLLDTAFGGSRIVDMLVGDPLPRIC